jgi:hypothetical protein
MNDQFSPGTALAGLVFVVLGTLFLLNEMDVVRIRPALVLPMLLIGLGISVLFSIVQPRRPSRPVD